MHAGQAVSPNIEGGGGGATVSASGATDINNVPEIRIVESDEVDETLATKLNNRLSIRSTASENNNDSEYNASAESNESSRRSSFDYPQFELRGRAVFGARVEQQRQGNDDEFEIIDTDSEVGTRV